MSDGNGNGMVAEAAIVKADDDHVELRAIEVDSGAGKSSQSASEDELWTPDDTFEPPEDLHALARLTDNSSIRETCIGAIARNTVGLGWDVDVWEGQQASPERRAECRQLVDALARRDRILDRPSFSSLMYAAKWDEEETGNGAIEVSRNRNTGKIDGLYHAPGAKVRRKRDLTGYVIGPKADAGINVDRREFSNFGEKVEYDSKGQPQRRLAKGASWSRNELIVFRRYTSASRHYGLPRDVALAFEYAAARFLNEWTASFFEGSGTPPTIVFVAGKEGKDGQRVHFTVPEATVRRIQQAVKSDSKPGARVAIIPVPPGTEVKDVQLAQKSADKDLTFEAWRKLHEHHVGAGFDLMPIFYGNAEDGGRYTAEVQRAFTLEETFDPDQREHEDRIYNSLFTDLGFTELRMVFKRLAVEGDAVKREAAVAMAEAGGITVREFRAAHGYGPLDEAIHGEGANERIVSTGKPRGAEDRVAVRATQDQRGLRPGIGGRIAKTGDDDHPHGVEHVEQAASDLEAELIGLVEDE